MIILFVFALGPVSAQQPGDPGGDPDVPIDGGIALLIGAGVAYGARKFRDVRKGK